MGNGRRRMQELENGEGLPHSQEIKEAGVPEKENINWPNWLLEKYAELPLPSLYDFILSQEKLAAEIRKQNRELRVQSEMIKDLPSQVENSLQKLQASTEKFDELNEEDEATLDEEDEKTLDEEDQSQKIPIEVYEIQSLLMFGMDAIFNLLNGMEKSQEQILTVVPEKIGFLIRKKPEWRCYLEEALKGYAQGIDTVRQKMLGHLADAQIEIISPSSGDVFDPSSHRALEAIKGGKRGCIAYSIRYGYKVHNQILRFADVSVYQ
jgi:hypothetical protein